MTTASTMNFKDNDVVFRVHLDTSKTLADGSPDPAWVREVTLPCLPANGVTLAQHLNACQQKAETQAAAAPRTAATLKVMSVGAVAPAQSPEERASAIAKALGQTDEERQRVAPLAKGLTMRVVGNSVVVRVVDGYTLLGEWSWGGQPCEGQTMEALIAGCERESLLLAEYELKRRRPQAPTRLNI